MSHQPLFHSAEIKLEKRASGFGLKLEGDADEWPTEITKGAYSQLPYLHQTQIDVALERVDEARGYAIGKLMAYPPGMTKKAAASNKQLLIFPLVVREREVAPLDVMFHKGDAHSVNEEKVASALQNPDVFAGTAKPDRFKGTDIGSQMQPPTNQGSPDAGSVIKTGSVLLEKVASTLRAADVERFRAQLREDTPVRAALLQDGEMRQSLLSLTTAKEKTAAEVGQLRRALTRPTVVQLREHGMGYKVKTANHACFAPVENEITRFEAESMLSGESMKVLRERGFVTFATDAVDTASKVKVAQVADRVGVYTTYAGGKEVQGVVVPAVMSIEGVPMSGHMFLGGNEHALQEKVAGVFEADLTLQGAHPRGRGVFVYQVGRQAIATEPVDIQHEYELPVGDGKTKTASLQAVRLGSGQPVRITLVPGIDKIAALGGAEVAVPDSFVFVPLRGSQVGVAEDPRDVDGREMLKVAGVDSVELLSDGAAFSLRGQNAASFHGQFLSESGAEFALGALGVRGSSARHFIEKAASAQAPVTVPHTRPVVKETELKARTMMKVASAFREVDRGLQRNLVPELAVLRRQPSEHSSLSKHASVIIDRETADAILSLNFVTPENVQAYVDAIPQLEKVSSKLAEILVASRLGMDDVREQAARNALRNVDEVLDGLHELRAKTQ